MSLFASIKAAREKTAFAFLLFCLRLKNSIDLFYAKRGIEAKTFLLIKLRLQIRLCTEGAKSIGYDEEFDNKVEIAALLLANSAVIDQQAALCTFKDVPSDVQSAIIRNMADYQRRKRDIDTIVERCKENKDIVNTVCAIYAVQIFYASKHQSIEKIEFYRNAMNSYAGELIEISSNKHLIKILTETKRQVGILKRAVADREAVLLSVSPEIVAAYISIIAACFIVGGYVHNWYLLGHFGIDVSKYFSVSDYLASAIEAVRLSATGAFFVVVALIFGIVRGSRVTYAQAKSTAHRHSRFMIIMAVVTVIFSTLAYLFYDIELYRLIYFPAPFIIFLVSEYLVIKVFNDPIFPMATLVFIGFFSISIYVSASKEIHRLEKIDTEKNSGLMFVLDMQAPFDQQTSVVLTMNSNFIFILDKQRDVYVVPKEKFQFAKISRQP